MLDRRECILGWPFRLDAMLSNSSAVSFLGSGYIGGCRKENAEGKMSQDEGDNHH